MAKKTSIAEPESAETEENPTYEPRWEAPEGSAERVRDEERVPSQGTAVTPQGTTRLHRFDEPLVTGEGHDGEFDDDDGSDGDASDDGEGSGPSALDDALAVAMGVEA